MENMKKLEKFFGNNMLIKIPILDQTIQLIS